LCRADHSRTTRYVPGGSEPKILSPTFDRQPESWSFSADGQNIFMTAEDLGLEKVYVMPAAGGEHAGDIALGDAGADDIDVGGE